MLNMPSRLSFVEDRSGAVTVEWVSLTASMILIVAVSMASIGGAADHIATDVVEDITGDE